MSLCDSLDNVCSADNTHQLAILHDRDALNFAFGKEHGNLAAMPIGEHHDQSQQPGSALAEGEGMPLAKIVL